MDFGPRDDSMEAPIQVGNCYILARTALKSHSVSHSIGRTDTDIIRYSRGGIAILFLVALCGLLSYAAFVRPENPVTLGQRRQYTIYRASPKSFTGFDFQQLRIYLALDGEGLISGPPIFHKATKAISVNIGGRDWVSDNCDIRSNMWPIVYSCPVADIFGLSPNPGRNAGPFISDNPYNNTLLSVDFSVLANLSGMNVEPFTTVKINVTSGSLYMGIARSFENLAAIAEPVPLFRGTQLLAAPSYRARESLLNYAAAAFGVSQFKRTLAVNFQIFSFDQSSNSSSTSATVQMIYSSNKPELLIEQEVVNNTVWNGLALLGGVWTIVNGVFAAIFGSTLLLTLFGMKPLSVYGFVHTMTGVKPSLTDGERNISSEEQARIIALLREHLMDSGGSHEPESSSASDTEMENLVQDNDILLPDNPVKELGGNDRNRNV
ncbi:hypothetical protein NP233_g7304 [Leucocoprinus birnbaumii]|uniref:Uncharacterized protein n=1 Tax=Leucocoprinus birnbaumii TaxID=56174 RepID=A0AAD5VPH2_9AGAR|nr:hypothetical protein NP233_g7304 [Leucocoprinus birnbaumii]